MKDEHAGCDHWCGGHRCGTLMAAIVVAVLLLGLGEYLLYRNTIYLKAMLAEGLMQLKESGKKPTLKDGFMMQNGKMMMRKDGETSMMQKSTTLSNGMKILMDGEIVKKDGSTTMMKEGWFMDMEGNMMMGGK